MILDDLYTPLDEAVAELHRRRNDKALCAAVAEFQREHSPMFMDGGPYACMVRAIITGDNEMERFISLAKQSGLSPLGLSFNNDRFDGRNGDKHTLCVLPFWVKHQVRMLHILRYFDDGMPILEMKCRNGMSLIDFHRHLLEQTQPGFSAHVRDISCWARGVSEKHFNYVQYLALFVVQGVLFENFRIDDEDERGFTETRAFPGFEKVVELFGVPPLIVRLFSKEEASDIKWWGHPESLYPFANELLKRKGR